MKVSLKEIFNNIFSIIYSILPNSMIDMKYFNKIKASLDGKQIFYVESNGFFYASSKEQAEKKFTGHKVFYLVERI